MQARATALVDDPHLIEPSGPADSEGLLVGEAGGETEHHKRKPFAGKAGQVLNTYLRAAGIARPDIRVTNIYPYWTGGGNPDPTPEQIRAEEWRLEREIEQNKPKVIGCLGRVAARWFLGDVDITTVHGVPHWSDRAKGALILPMVHPAAGFYDPQMAAFAQEDVMKFAHYLKNPSVEKPVGEIEVLESSIPRHMTKLIVDAAVDTEGLEDKPWGLSYSHDGKTTFVVTGAKPRVALAGRITFQNALHDLKILRAMGVDTSSLDYDDTMVMLFNLQLEPQGLKAAAYRHLGLKMHDFDDVVRPHFDRVALDYLERASLLRYEKSAAIPVADYAKRKMRLYKPQSANRRIANIIKGYWKKKAEREQGIDKGTDRPLHLEKKWADLEEVSPPSCVMQGAAPDYQGDIILKMRGEEFPDFSIFHVPRSEAVRYSGIDAAATALLKPVLMKELERKGLVDVYEMDRRALKFVDRMQRTGMRVNVEMLKELEQDLRDQKERARRKVQRLVGDRWFNPGSDDQVARWLYKYKSLPILKKTQGGEGSTAIVALKMLQGYYKEDAEVAEFAAGVREYRENDKYLGTFVEPIFFHMKRDERGDWRIHPNFRVTRVVSGRLSSFDPNVLAFPTRTELGKRIRLCFEARPGYVIVSCDASQIELRKMAHLSRDRTMRVSFEEETDLHSLTASIIFKDDIKRYSKPRAPLQESRRYVAKTINFAVMYGISAKALLEQLFKADIFDYSLDDCKRFIKEWFDIYGSVRRFLEWIWAEAEKSGFVRDMWGRICYVPNVRVGDDQMREAARRLAGNFPVQSGAHGLVKRAENRLEDWIRDEGLEEKVAPWLQMHDELDLEVEQGMSEEVAKMVQAMMCADQGRIRVPLKAEYGIGKSWGSAK